MSIKTLLLSALAVAALSVPAAAMADDYGHQTTYGHSDRQSGAYRSHRSRGYQTQYRSYGSGYHNHHFRNDGRDYRGN